MASGYSQPGSTYRHLNPIDVFDEQLVATVLGAKQQRYDKNLAAIDAALEEYGQIDLARTKDKQYLQDRLKTLTDQVNNAGMQDLSSSSVTRNIHQHIDKALDNELLEQMANTQKIRKFGTDVAEYKKKNDGSYAKQNEAYALNQAGFQEYMQGGKDTLGNLEYNPYVDVAKAQREILDESFSVDKGITRKLPNGKGYFVESTHHGLTPSEVRMKVSNNLTPQMQKQLEIDAWARYGESAPERYEQYVAPQIESLKKERDTLMLNYEGLTAAEKAAVDEKVAYVDGTIKEIGSLKDSSEALYRFLGKEDLIGGLAATYSPVETNLSYSSDASHYRETANAAKQADAAVGRGDANGDGVDDVSTRSLATDPEDNWIPTESAEQEIKSYEGDLRTMVNSSYNRLSQQDQSAFDNAYRDYIKTNGLSDTPANKASFMLEKSNSGKGDYFTPEEYHHAKTLEREYRRKLKIKTDNYQEALKEQEAVNTQKVLTEIVEDNPGIKMTNENGQVVSIGDYIKKAGGLKNLSEDQKKTLMSSVYADYALSKTKDYSRDDKGTHADNAYNIGRLAGMYGEVGKEPMLVNPGFVVFSEYTDQKFNTDFEGLKKDMQLPENLTEEQFDKHIRPLVEKQDNGFLNKIPGLGAAVNGMEQIMEPLVRNGIKFLGAVDVEKNIVIGGEGTKTRRALETAMKNGTYDKPSFWKDDSVEDDQYINNLLNDRGDFQSRYEAKMAEDAGKFAQNQEIIVQPSGSRKGEEIAAHRDLLRYNGAFDPKKHIYVRKSPVEGEYEVYQVLDDSVTVKNGEALDSSKVISATVAERDLAGDPFFDNITKQKNARRITAENTKELISNNTGFADEKDQRKYVVGLAKAMGVTDEKQLARFTSQGAKTSLINSHPNLFSEEGGAPFKQLVKDAVDNSHLFRLNVQANDLGRFDMAIQYPVVKDGKKTWKNLKVMPTGQNDITETVKMIDMAPQTFFYEYMDRLLTNVERNGSESVEDDLKLLQTILYPQQ